MKGARAKRFRVKKRTIERGSFFLGASNLKKIDLFQSVI